MVNKCENCKCGKEQEIDGMAFFGFKSEENTKMNMRSPQLAQIDCQKDSCAHNYRGACSIEPQVTFNLNETFRCWSYSEDFEVVLGRLIEAVIENDIDEKTLFLKNKVLGMYKDAIS